MNIITIGDVHGRAHWVEHFFNTKQDFLDLYDYFKENNNHEEYSQFRNYRINEYDKVIFIGDYCDSFDIPPIQILDNVKNIIKFKEMYPEKVVLLLGNHDIHYFWTTDRYSGFELSIYHDLKNIFESNLDKFKIAFQIDNFLWTHAGVTSKWWEKVLPSLESEDNRFKFLYDECKNISDYLNTMFQVGDRNINSISNLRRRGYIEGADWAGPLWAHDTEMNAALTGYHQIVGHTHKEKVLTSYRGHNTSVTFIDTQTDDKFDFHLMKLK